MREVVIVSAVRTPIGRFNGGFKDTPAWKLGGIVLEEAILRAGLKPEDIHEVIMGNVLQAGQGQNPARQAAVEAKIPYSVPAWTLNLVCGSGLRSVIAGAQSILLGERDCVLVGGMENMSLAPYLLPKAREGYQLGHGQLVDSVINEGLWDAFYDMHMGLTAEHLAEKFSIGREEQDLYAVGSQNRAQVAIENQLFKQEIVPVELPSKKSGSITISQDEFPRFNSTFEDLARLKPAFKKEGTVTAGNASGINDGAAALVLMSKERALALELKPLVKILSWEVTGLDPMLMGLGPVTSSQKALAKSGLGIEDMDLVEINEAFAVQSLAVIKELGLAYEKTNVNGGAIALGHPIGASGARILVSLLHELNRRKSQLGLASLCIGGGQGIAMVVSREI